MNANWDVARQLIRRGADVNQWDLYGEAPLFTAWTCGIASTAAAPRSMRPNQTTVLAIVELLLDRGADANMQLFFKPANVRGSTNTRGATPLIRAAGNGDLEVVKLLLAHGADATVYLADRQTPIHAVLAGRAPEPQALELIRTLQKAGTDVNVVALINHGEEVRGGTALHLAVRRRFKEAIKLLASYGIDMNAVDQDGLTALDYTQSRGFMPFMRCRRRSSRRKRRCCANWARPGSATRTRCGPCSVRRRACGPTSGRSASRACTSRSTSARLSFDHGEPERRDRVVFSSRALPRSAGPACCPSVVGSRAGVRSHHRPPTWVAR
jgi:ankyrin repeat protein